MTTLKIEIALDYGEDVEPSQALADAVVGELVNEIDNATLAFALYDGDYDEEWLPGVTVRAWLPSRPALAVRTRYAAADGAEERQP